MYARYRLKVFILDICLPLTRCNSITESRVKGFYSSRLLKLRVVVQLGSDNVFKIIVSYHLRNDGLILLSDAGTIYRFIIFI